MITKTLIKKSLSKYKLGKIIYILPVETSGNIAFLIITKNKQYFLRLSPLGIIRQRSKSEILAEIDFLHFLKQANFPVILPLINNKNEELISINNHNGYVREFVSGSFKLSPSNNDIKKIGQILGRLHNLSKDFSSKYKRTHLFNLPITQKKFSILEKKILKSNFKYKEKFVTRFKKEIFKLQFPQSLPSGIIHEDLGRRHVIWKGDKILAIIDFDRSYFAPFLLDIGQAARSWCFDNNWQKWNNTKFKILITAYQKERKLSKIEKKYLLDSVKFAILERALSFCLISIKNSNKEDEEFAFDSLFKQIKQIK